jgi:SfnB family sulfur acquisition oxidoreductase
MTAQTSPTTPGAARIIADDAEALAVARELSERFAGGAAERDATRRQAAAELDELSSSGLLGITVPREHGGAGVSTVTVAEVFRLLAVADPNIAQIPQNHFAFVNALLENASPRQLSFFLGEVLAGKRLGNAQAEAGARTPQDTSTRLEPAGDGYVVNGTKNYSTGALFAHWIPVTAKDERDHLQIAYVPRDHPGVSVVDDWNGMGQRLTASGTVLLKNVSVPADWVVPHHLTFTRPQLHGALAQVIHAAIDVGIARAAVNDAVGFLHKHSRPWGESGVDSAAEDPLTIYRFGELTLKLRAAEALLEQAARAVDSAREHLDESSAAWASIEVATAKAFAIPVSVELSSALFELCGTRSAVDSENLHRHWRNARTHTLHDPVRWKLEHIGRYVLNGTLPPASGQI